MLHKLSLKIYKLLVNKLGLKRLVKESVLDDLKIIASKQNVETQVEEYYVDKIKTVVNVILISLIIVIMSVVAGAMSGNKTFIERNTYGGVSKSSTYNVKVDGWKNYREITVTASERRYTQSQFDQIINKNISSFKKEILGDNKSWKSVNNNLNLKEKFGDYPFEVTYYTQTPEVISSTGELLQDNLNKKGKDFTLSISISYNKFKYEGEVQGVAYYKIQTQVKEEYKQLMRAVKADDESSADSQYLKLPLKINGKKVTWKASGNNNIWIVLLLGVIAAVLIYFLKDKKLHEKIEKRNRCLISDYPGFLSEFTLLVGAGLTPRHAIEKIIMTNKTSSKFLIKELKMMIKEIKSGVPEKTAYIHMSDRTGIKEYIRFVTLVTQNIDNGTKGLKTILEQESVDAYKDRKSFAKLRAEEAGTKLLLPMGMMLIVVLMIVIIPALIGMNI